jgi:hypothetical protein
MATRSDCFAALVGCLNIYQHPFDAELFRREPVEADAIALPRPAHTRNTKSHHPPERRLGQAVDPLLCQRHGLTKRAGLGEL